MLAMLKQFGLSQAFVPGDWYQEFPPAEITVHNLKTGTRIQEPSLVAVARAAPEKPAAVGRAALAYENAPGMVVFSPFRHGQIAHYHTALFLIRSLLGQAGQRVPVPKPIMCVHIQERTTQVEEQALAEAALQAGARKVFLYTDPLPAMLDSAQKRKELRHAVIIHIEPRD